MILKRVLTYLFGTFLISSPALAQQFGAFPPSTKWLQINTDTARIIFTSEERQVAQLISAYIHKAAADTPFSLGSRFKKINIVLHNKTTLANGYVGLAPFRSEFYLIPTSDVFSFGNLPWYENLAIHEYRHVQQYSNFNRGLSKLFYYLFGEAGLDLATTAAIPNWFYEGDAVHTETALTSQGRGRLPDFLNTYKSLWISGRNYSWMKLRNGSLKDYVPDHYPLGYLLVNYGYLKYGTDFWKKVTADASAYNGLFYPFQTAIRKYSGVSFRKFRNMAFDFYRQPLVGSREQQKSPYKTVTDIIAPQYIGKDSLLFVLSAYNRLPSFYLKDNERTRRLALKNISTESWISSKRGKITYTSYSTNSRWSLVNYNDIVIYDIRKRMSKSITHHQRYFTPDLSSSGNKIAAVHIDDSLHTDLHIIDAVSGRVLKSITGGSEAYYTNPRFVGDSAVIVGVQTPDARMTLQLYNLSTGQWAKLTPPSNNTFGHPFVNADTVFFTSNIFGNDDLFALDLRTKAFYQLTADITGNYFPSVYAGQINYSHFTAKGYLLQQKALKDLLWKPLGNEMVENKSLIYAVAGEHELLPKERNFEVTRYSSISGLINIHSWVPNYQAPVISLNLYSENILNTLTGQLYYQYNQDENSHTTGISLSYGALYPVLTAGGEYIINRSIITTDHIYHYNQSQFYAGYSIPLDFTKGKTYKFFDFGSSLVLEQILPAFSGKDSLNYRKDLYLSHFITWSHYLPTAIQHIYPKLGYTASVYLRHLMTTRGYQFLTDEQIFLPSFGNHSLVLNGSFQKTDHSSDVFSNRFMTSRGYDAYYFSAMWRLSGNYHMPLVYPDWGFANLFYLQRVRSNFFYDFARVYSSDLSQNRNLRSFGAEVFMDTKLWNELPVSFGIRLSHLLDNDFSPGKKAGSNWFEFIIPMNLTSY